MNRTVVVKAMAIVRRPLDGAILVSEGRDSDGWLFHRPLGGTVEFGERSAQSVEREFMEELGLRLRTTRFLGVVENLFRHQEADGHEVVFLHEGVFEDQAVYELSEIPRVDGTVGAVSRWRPAGVTDPPLVPRGIEMYLEAR